MSQFADGLADVAILLFVISSMFGMGLELSISQIVAPLRRVSLVVKALIANFILVPLLGYIIVHVIDLNDPKTIGLMLMATAAGAAFLPRLAKIAKGDIALAVGLMSLMTTVTIIFLPLALPILLPGIEIDPLEVAQTLITFILIPLAIGLLIKARYEDIATTLQPHMSQTASYSLMLAAVLLLVLNFDNLLGEFGTGTYLAVILFVAVSILLGYIMGGPGNASRRVLGLGTAQRDTSTALLVASRNFDDPGVIVMILVGSVVMLVGLMVVAGEFGKRAQD